MNLIKILFIMSVMIMLSSCVGIAVMSHSKQVTDNEDPNLVGCFYEHNIGFAAFCNSEKASLRTIENIIKFYGPPKKRYSKEGLDYLVYNEDFVWRGIFPMIIIPIPLIIPIGHHETILVFDNNKLIKITKEFDEMWGAFCGYNLDSGKFGCTAGGTK